MPYCEFTLEMAERALGITTREAELFPAASPRTAPEWPPAMLARGTKLAPISETARSEFIVAPILLAAREVTGDRFAIFSGQRLDVDPDQRLSGECDLILALSPPSLPPLHAPLMTVVEAKKNDVESALGQRIAQMVGALRFNAASGRDLVRVSGCVTTGETWQFLKLADRTAQFERRR